MGEGGEGRRGRGEPARVSVTAAEVCFTCPSRADEHGRSVHIGQP